MTSLIIYTSNNTIGGKNDKRSSGVEGTRDEWFETYVDFENYGGYCCRYSFLDVHRGTEK